MTADELPIDAYFRFEDYTWDDICHLPGVSRDEIGEWDCIARKVVEDRFRDACRNLWPLIEGLNFRSVSIGIDLLGMEPGAAGYYHNDSIAEKGVYGFYVSAEVFEAYLKSHFGKNYELSPHKRYMWEHELIHLCDHKSITEFRYSSLSTDIREFLIHYLLSFRNEGIANLYFAMQGHNDVQDPETARQIFLCGIQNFEAARWEDESIIRQKEQEVMTTHDFYSVGPWLILHALSCADCQITTPLAGSVAGRIIAGEAVAYDDIMEVISHALKITNGDFIRCLTKPGLDDKPFIEGSILRSFGKDRKDKPQKGDP